MENAVILARVSSTKQEKEGLSLKEIQLPALRDYAKFKGLEVKREFIFSETADYKIRKKFDEMVDYVKANNDVKVIIAYRVDRATRNFRDAVLMDDLRLHHDKEIHFVYDRLVIRKDTVGRDIQDWDLRVFLAKQYLNRLKEDARNSASAMLDKGLLPGKAPYGYRNIVQKDKKKWVIVEPIESKVVQNMYEWYRTGCSSLLEVKNKLKKEFNLDFSKGYVDFILKNPFYAGSMLYDGQAYPHNYENVISRGLFDEVQRIKAGYMKKHSKFAGLPYVYRGMIRCATCGCMITPEKKKGRYVYYHCTEYYGKHNADWVREEDLTVQFARMYKSLQIPLDVIEQITGTLRKSHQDKTQFHRTMLQSYQDEYQKYETRVEKMYEDKLDGKINESLYNKKSEEYRLKQQELRGKISRLSIADEEYYLTSEYLLQLANRAHDLFMSSEAEEKRQLLKLTLQNLKLRGKKIDFELVKPFDQVFACTSRQTWLGRKDSNLRLRIQSPLSYH
jgi:site-specific DNA recombinase